MVYIILILSLAGIVFGADYLVSGSVSIAGRLKVSDFVIGAAIVDYIVMIAAVAITAIFGIKGRIRRLGGAFMFLCFVAYTWYLTTNQIA